MCPQESTAAACTPARQIQSAASCRARRYCRSPRAHMPPAVREFPAMNPPPRVPPPAASPKFDFPGQNSAPRPQKSQPGFRPTLVAAGPSARAGPAPSHNPAPSPHPAAISRESTAVPTGRGPRSRHPSARQSPRFRPASPAADAPATSPAARPLQSAAAAPQTNFEKYATRVSSDSASGLQRQQRRSVAHKITRVQSSELRTHAPLPAHVAGYCLRVANHAKFPMPHEFTDSFLTDAVRVLHSYKRLAERAIAQVPDHALTIALDAESNSIAIIVKHMVGNMRSRWTDFLPPDGEKPDRNRDTEFESPAATRDQLIAQWEAGWKHVFDALASLTDADLGRTVFIRNEPHSVTQAINRQVAHYSYHVGQIVFLAKHFASANWTSLSVPRGKSAVATANIRAAQESK